MSEPKWNPEEPITPAIKTICFQVKPDIKKLVGTDFEVYVPLRFRFQNGDGMNYLFKVEVSSDAKCVHAMICQASGGELTVTGVQYPKALSDPLVPFPV